MSFEEIKAVYFEERCPFDHLEDTKVVADALTLPVAGGEQEYSDWRFRWMIANRGVDIVQPDLHYYGGMIRSMRVAKMADVAGMPTTVHISGGFGFVYMFYMIIVVIEIWFSYREDLIDKYNRSSGIAKSIYRIIILGNTTINDKTRKYDRNIVIFFAAFGIPVACILHGYVGFLFGSIKANLWWSTPLMFIIFIFSAIVSGLGLLPADPRPGDSHGDDHFVHALNPPSFPFLPFQKDRQD